MKSYDSPGSVPERFRLPPERESITHRFKVDNFKGYITIGLYPDGKVGEIFIEAEKQGSTISGLLGAFARSVSIGLQYGIPLDKFITGFKHMRFSPEGRTETKDIRQAGSIIDYIFRYLELRFTNGHTFPWIRPKDPIEVCFEKARQDRISSGDDSSDPCYPDTPQRSEGNSPELQLSCKSDT